MQIHCLKAKHFLMFTSFFKWIVSFFKWMLQKGLTIPDSFALIISRRFLGFSSEVFLILWNILMLKRLSLCLSVCLSLSVSVSLSFSLSLFLLQLNRSWQQRFTNLHFPFLAVYAFKKLLAKLFYKSFPHFTNIKIFISGGAFRTITFI